MPSQPNIDIQQLAYGAEMTTIAEAFEGPCLHIGSRTQVIDQQIEGRASWRSRLQDKQYIGADLEAGENVDAVLDITAPMVEIKQALPDTNQFQTVICAHLLEHVKNPFDAARNISELVAPGGHVFIQVPWVQAFHPFPDDYWRISLSGLKLLFPEMETVDALYSGGSSDVCYRLMRQGSVATERDALKLEADVFQLMMDQKTNQGLLRQLNSAAYLSRAYMPVCVVTWVGRKMIA